MGLYVIYEYINHLLKEKKLKLGIPYFGQPCEIKILS